MGSCEWENCGNNGRGVAKVRQREGRTGLHVYNTYVEGALGTLRGRGGGGGSRGKRSGASRRGHVTMRWRDWR